MTSTLKADKIEGVTSSGTVQMPAGHVIQIQSATHTGSLATNSSTFADLPGLSISFTNKFSTSKLLFIVQNHVYVGAGSSGTWQGVDFRVLKGSTAIGHNTSGTGYGISHAGGNDSTTRVMDYMVFMTEHTPSSTSALTYKVQCATIKGNADNEINQNSYGSGGRLVIMEIAQ